MPVSSSEKTENNDRYLVLHPALAQRSLDNIDVDTALFKRSAKIKMRLASVRANEVILEILVYHNFEYLLEH